MPSAKYELRELIKRKIIELTRTTFGTDEAKRALANVGYPNLSRVPDARLAALAAELKIPLPASYRWRCFMYSCEEHHVDSHGTMQATMLIGMRLIACQRI